MKLEIEQQEYNHFLKLWHSQKFQDQRFGQAFYNHFKLERMADQSQLCGLFELDGDNARETIEQIFQFN